MRGWDESDGFVQLTSLYKIFSKKLFPLFKIIKNYFKFFKTWPCGPHLLSYYFSIKGRTYRCARFSTYKFGSDSIYIYTTIKYDSVSISLVKKI